MNTLTKFSVIVNIFFLLFYNLEELKGQDTLYYNNNNQVVDIGKYARYHIDSQDSISLSQIQLLPDGAFQKSKTEIMNFGNTIASIDLKLIVKNLTTEQLYLSFENNELQYIEVMTIDESGNQLIQQGGIFNTISNKYFQRGNTILKIGTKPIQIFMKVKTHSSFYLPINLSSLPSLMNQNYKLDVFKGITFGIMLAMCLYNLFIFFLVRDRLYLYYCIYVLAGIWTYSHLNGLWYFTWSDYPFLNRFLGIQLFALSAALFSFRFLNTKEVTPRLYKIMNVMIILIVISIPVEYLDIQPLTNNFLQFYVSLCAVVLFSAGVSAYYQGNKSAKYFILAWMFFLAGTIITLLIFTGWLPYNFWTFNASLIGACFENLFLSFALANKINIYREETAKAQLLALQRLEDNERLIIEQNKILEEKVLDRTNELETSLNVLKATQAQLIQSEKLASLGELTAGIAHEIQNPLNFVNNFSELSVDIVNDLKDEMSKPQKDNEYIEELFTDLSSNQQKINHHGKRASSIVKGMLEHSREKTADKELIDINKLVDEYIRLSYHGLRAKDKSFNADIKLELDESIVKINAIPQDLGRVLLNLFNNAFYAVKDKKNNSNDAGYQPTVTVSTEINNDEVMIRIKDNGTGMPENVRDKVFQPFFTTKPTGSGTGLGLSISYDIITKDHGGKLEVESTLGVCTIFIIKLPLHNHK